MDITINVSHVSDKRNLINAFNDLCRTFENSMYRVTDECMRDPDIPQVYYNSVHGEIRLYNIEDSDTIKALNTIWTTALEKRKAKERSNRKEE